MLDIINVIYLTFDVTDDLAIVIATVGPCCDASIWLSGIIIWMALGKKDVMSLLMHWSYIFLALIHRYLIVGEAHYLFSMDKKIMILMKYVYL